MQTNNRASQAMFIEFPSEPSDAAVRVDAHAQGAQIGRSEENVLQWTSYLPKECVATMIGMGWDCTT